MFLLINILVQTNIVSLFQLFLVLILLLNILRFELWGVHCREIVILLVLISTSTSTSNIHNNDKDTTDS